MLTATRTSRRSVALPDDDLFGWLRYYGAALILSALIGAAVFVDVAALTRPGVEAWTLVVDTRAELPSRQLSVVAETLFNTSVAPSVGSHLDLRPVPDARLLFLVAADDDGVVAAETSLAAAVSIVSAFERVGYPGFEVVGTMEPGPVRSRPLPTVFAALGAATGLLVGVASSIVLYRRRRPVLSVERARDLVGADRIEVVRGRWRWLGGMRSTPPIPTRRGVRRLQGRLVGSPVVPGARRLRAAAIERRLGTETAEDPPRTRVIVCGAGTPASSLRDLPPGGDLIWIT